MCLTSEFIRGTESSWDAVFQLSPASCPNQGREQTHNTRSEFDSCVLHVGSRHNSMPWFSQRRATCNLIHAPYNGTPPTAATTQP